MVECLSQRLRVVAVSAVLLLHAATAAAAQFSVGIARIKFPAPESTATSINAFVFYPATRGNAGARIGPYVVAAGFDAVPADGRRPLVVLSHGQGGSALGHHDLATYLASHGYVVASLEHPKDNVRDSSGVGTPDVLFGRPRQVSALIDALEVDHVWGEHIDADRVGIAGFSMGGYTGLVLVGAKPDFMRLVQLCNAGVEPGVCALLSQKGASLDPREPVAAYASALQKAAETQGPLSDPRVKAAFVMAPMAMVFDRKGFESVNRPVYLHYGTADQMLDPARNAASVIKWVPTLAGRTSIVGSDHWVYLAPCSPELRSDAPEICSDPPGIDRLEIHQQIQKAALAFFDATLR